MLDFLKRHRWLAGSLLAVVLVLAGGLAARSAADAELTTVAQANARPIVAVVLPKRADETVLTLPGTIAARNEAAINARTSGYVARWYADIGDTVRAGQTLAVLDTPEVAQQLAQAKADLQLAGANRALAATTAERWTALRAKDAVSQQETDEKQGRLAAASASVNSARANVSRLATLANYARIRAPFSGVVTSRSAQLGALVSAGNPAGQPLFTIADVSSLRVYVRVPQSLAGQITRGAKATLSLPEYPGENFEAVMVRDAGAVERGSGSVLTEFAVSNPQRRLKPGGFASLAIPFMARPGTLTLPGSSLITGPNGPMVAVVGKNGRVAMRKVSVGRDEGKTIEILTGIAPTDRIVLTPPDALAPGDLVRVVAPKKGTGNAPR